MVCSRSVESARLLSLYQGPGISGRGRRDSNASIASSLGGGLKEYDENLEIPDLTEVQRIGQATRITRTVPGADYENQFKVDGEYGKYPLLIRRIHHLRSDEPLVHLQIQSKELIKFLGSLPNSVLTLPIHDFPMKIREPYQGVFHYRHEIQQAYSDPRFAYIKEDLSYLIKFRNDELAPKIRDFKVLHHRGLITFEYLWALFKPGDLVALKRADNTGNPNFWLAVTQSYHEPEKNGEKFWEIGVASTEIVTGKVGHAKRSFRFPAFQGTKPISELEVLPLSYLPPPEADKIKKDALERSTEYQVLLRPLLDDTDSGGRRTPAHRQYRGPIWIPTRTREGGTGCEFFDPPTCNVGFFSSSLCAFSNFCPTD